MDKVQKLNSNDHYKIAATDYKLLEIFIVSQLIMKLCTFMEFGI
jgi:hypothetical protein